MADNIAIFENPGLDDAIHIPQYFAGDLEQHLLQQRIPVSGRSVVTEAKGTAPAIVEISVPTGLLDNIETAIVQFLAERKVTSSKDAHGKAGGRTIYYRYDRPAANPNS